MNQQQTSKLRSVLIVGGSMMAPVAIGLVISGFAMKKAIQSLNDQGSANPDLLASEYGMSLIAMLSGSVVSAIVVFAWIVYFLIRRK